MNDRQTITDAAELLPNSAVEYKNIDVSAADYRPTKAFRAINIDTGGDGDVTIIGLNGVAATMTLAAGFYPFAGKAIVSGTTTATGITAIF